MGWVSRQPDSSNRQSSTFSTRSEKRAKFTPFAVPGGSERIRFTGPDDGGRLLGQQDASLLTDYRPGLGTVRPWRRFAPSCGQCKLLIMLSLYCLGPAVPKGCQVMGCAFFRIGDSLQPPSNRKYMIRRNCRPAQYTHNLKDRGMSL